MSNPIMPVSATLPAPSPYTSPQSHWEFRTVVLLIGAAAVGLLLIWTLYSRFRSESRDIERPKTTIPPQAPTIDPEFRTDQPHSSGFRYNDQPCLNEAQLPRFLSYAEGFFNIKLDALFPRAIGKPVNMTVRCSVLDQLFFVRQVKNTDTARPLQFFLPNIPYQGKMQITIEIEYDGEKFSQTIQQDVKVKRGIYNIQNESHLNGCQPLRLPAGTITRLYELSAPPSISTRTYNIRLNEDYELDIQPKVQSTFHTIRGQGFNTVAYLKIVHQDTDSQKEAAIALPFFNNNGELILSSQELIENWKDAYFQATGNQASPNLNLFLHEIKLIVYKHERESLPSDEEEPIISLDAPSSQVETSP